MHSAALNLKVDLSNKESLELLDELDSTIYTHELLAQYFTCLFTELAKRAGADGKGIRKTVFLEYINLPGIVAERVYSRYDKLGKGLISEKEFVDSSIFFFSPRFEDKLRIVFELFDFNNDSKIEAEDIRTLLSQMPLQKMSEKLKSKSSKLNLENVDIADRFQSLKEIQQFIDCLFRDKTHITFDQFKECTETLCSDLFIIVYFLFRQNIPFYDQVPLYASEVKRIKRKAKDMPQPKKISSPKLLHQFSPVGRLIRRSSYVGSADGTTAKQEKNASACVSPAAKNNDHGCESSFEKATQRLTSETAVVKKDTSTSTSSKKSRFFQEAVQNTCEWIIEETKDHSESVIFCKCGKICKEAFSLCEECIASGKLHEAGGYLYLKRDQNNLDRYWFQLINKELYCYKSRDDKEYVSMMNITGYVVEEDEEIKINSMYTIYPFSLCARWDKRTLYSLKVEERGVWVDSIRSVLCYSDIYKSYDLGEFLGSGKYGEVRRSKQRETGRVVAIKILNKKKMKIKNYDMVRNEIEALKLCQHPNIVRLFDVLENVDYIFLVMELLSGGTLRDYMKKNNSRIPESMARHLVRSIASALEYMHKYGIVHRDLKPINILLVDDSPNPVIKIVDFGLAAILGPAQSCRGYAGTLDFCSPEVIIGLLYAQSADVWSMGVVAYYLLYGVLPFSSTNDNDLKRAILKDEPKEKTDRVISAEAKDFLQKVLMKNPKHRLTIGKVLEHPWLKGDTATESKQCTNSLFTIS